MGKYDGSIKIKTKIDDSEIDKDLKSIDSKIKKFEKEEVNSIDNKIAEKTRNNTKEFNAQITQLERRIAENMDQLKLSGKHKFNSEETERLNVEIEKMKNKLLDLKKKQEQLNAINLTKNYESASEKAARLKEETRQAKEESRKLNEEEKEQQKIIKENEKAERAKRKEIEKGQKALQKGTSNSIKQIGKLALGIFSIASAYRLVSTASSTLGQYDEQYAKNIEYIRFALAQGLAPVFKYIVNLVATLLGYLNYLLSAWFGINLFANASAKKFAEMSKSAGSTANSAKEIKKQLAGFDEMTVLGDSNQGTLGGGSGGIVTPSFDLSQMEGEPPKWLTWIKEHGDIIKKVLEGIAAAFIAIKLGLAPLQGLGLFLIFDGVTNLIEDLKDPTWENFGKILKDIGEILMGIALIVGITGATGPFGIMLLVIGQILSIAGGVIDWVKALIKFIQDPSWDNFFDIIRGGIKSIGIVGDVILWLVDVIFGSWENAVKFAKEKIDILIGILQKICDWIYQNIILNLGNIVNAFIETIVALVKNAIIVLMGWWTILGNIIKLPFEVAWDYIQGWFNSMVQIFTGIGNIFSGIFSGDMTQVVYGFQQVFQGVFNNITNIFRVAINAVIRGINVVTSSLNKISFDMPSWLGGGSFRMPYIPQINYLATGGIINMPNKGVPLGYNVRGGEAGAERCYSTNR